MNLKTFTCNKEPIVSATAVNIYHATLPMDDNDTTRYPDTKIHEVALAEESAEMTYIEEVFSKKLKAVC